MGSLCVFEGFCQGTSLTDIPFCETVTLVSREKVSFADFIPGQTLMVDGGATAV